jgi:hypothetical protein
LALFGRLPSPHVDGVVMQASENLHSRRHSNPAVLRAARPLLEVTSVGRSKTPLTPASV